MANRFRFRTRVTAFVFILASFVIVGRLYQLQIIHGEAYAARAEAYFTQPLLPLLDRGAIYFTDRNGTERIAAVMRSGITLTLNPAEVEDVGKLYTALREYTALTREEFFERARRKDSRRQVVARQLPAEVGTALQAQALHGLVLEADRWRFYPGDSLAAHALGFVAYRDDAQEGRYGLERYYEETLSRSRSLYRNFFIELFGSVGGILRGETQSGDLITTIEPTVQNELERTLADYAEQWAPRQSGGIIMDPRTGAILAMAVHPTFNLNHFNRERDSAIFRNPLVEGVYEMGSIVKPLTIAAGVDTGLISAETSYSDTGRREIDGRVISNFDGRARGRVEVQEILSQSLNLGAAFVAEELGPARMREYFLERFKLGEETGIDLPGEVRGLMKNLASPRRLEYATASFGQGIATTPIATARALATLANGGYLITPHLGRAIRHETGITRPLGWGEPRQVLAAETATTMSRMLTEVVDKALRGGIYKLPRYSVAAKTGTAQIARTGGGGYYEDRFLHSFFGYFPSYDARFLVFLFALEPQGAQYASETLAPPFHALTQFLISYYNIPPDR